MMQATIQFPNLAPLIQPDAFSEEKLEEISSYTQFITFVALSIPFSLDPSLRKLANISPKPDFWIDLVFIAIALLFVPILFVYVNFPATAAWLAIEATVYRYFRDALSLKWADYRKYKLLYHHTKPWTEMSELEQEAMRQQFTEANGARPPQDAALFRGESNDDLYVANEVPNAVRDSHPSQPRQSQP